MDEDWFNEVDIVFEGVVFFVVVVDEYFVVVFVVFVEVSMEDEFVLFVKKGGK